MFKLLGALPACCAMFAAFTGRVFAKAGAGATTVGRAESAASFWSVLAVYAGLSAALWFWF